MISEHIEILIIKYCTNQINTDEVRELTAWVKQNNNSVLFQDYINVNFTIEELKMVSSNNGDVWKVIKKHITTSKKKTGYWKYAAAASVLLLVSISILFTRKDNVNTSTPISVNHTIKIGTDKATLTLEDGTNIPLEKGKKYVANNLSSNGEEIIYNTTTTTKPEIAYNYLTIPRGGQYFIKLSDGTQVWLNSESKLKYPVSFIDGQTREVELVYGEAYFDVTPSTEHNGAKFKVLSGIQEIEVLGTEFNIKAYKDETSTYTTLVEGKVEVRRNTSKNSLIPSQQAITNQDSETIQVRTVNVYDEVSWKNGVFSFKNKPLKEIMKVISRWYDADFIFTYNADEDILFNGVMYKKYSIEEILKAIMATSDISYEIKEKQILIK